MKLVIDTDFSIHLCHDSKKVEDGGSRLGMRLVAALKEFGLVNHSVWLEMNSKCPVLPLKISQTPRAQKL